MTRRKFLKICAGSLVGLATGGLLPKIVTYAGGYREIPVLLYHSVGYDSSGPLMITPERFANDLRQLSDWGYQSITLAQLQDFIFNSGAVLPEYPVLITFDDSYLNQFENAFPILKSYSMTAAFFVITGLLWDYPDRLKPMHIAEMSEAGMSFGSHTVNHRPLAELSDEDAQEELLSSKATLESITGKSIGWVAYPRGSYHQGTIRLAQNIGYVGGFTVTPGKVNNYSSPFELRRIAVFRYDGGVSTSMARRG